MLLRVTLLLRFTFLTSNNFVSGPLGLIPRLFGMVSLGRQSCRKSRKFPVRDGPHLLLRVIVVRRGRRRLFCRFHNRPVRVFLLPFRRLLIR